MVTDKLKNSSMVLNKNHGQVMNRAIVNGIFIYTPKIMCMAKNQNGGITSMDASAGYY